MQFIQQMKVEKNAQSFFYEFLTFACTQSLTASYPECEFVYVVTGVQNIWYKNIVGVYNPSNRFFFAVRPLFFSFIGYFFYHSYEHHNKIFIKVAGSVFSNSFFCHG